MKDKLKPIAYTTTEGGEWIPWKDYIPSMIKMPNATICHAIKFDDGSIFDMVNGWRKKENDVRIVPRTLLEFCLRILEDYDFYKHISNEDWNLAIKQLKESLAIEKPVLRSTVLPCREYHSLVLHGTCQNCGHSWGDHLLK